MRALVQEKERAIQLRKNGLSYKDILEKVPVAKSSLSAWLQNLPLTPGEKEALKRRKNGNISRGRIRAGAVLHAYRLAREAALHTEAQAVFRRHAKDPIFFAGIALYWAEGSKRNATSFGFINSDPDMILFMVRWLSEYLSIPASAMRARLYIHKPYASENCERFWHQKTAIPLGNFRKTIYKPTGLLIKKRPYYKGCLRIECGGRAALLKMLFWQNMLIEESLK